MANRCDAGVPRKRTASRIVNYSESDADAELSLRLEAMEERDCKKVKKEEESEYKYQAFLDDKMTSWNFVPNLPPSFRKTSRFANFIELEGSTVNVERQCLFSMEGEILKVNDTIYMVSEPPGEPYYIGRVVEFLCRPEFRDLVEEVKQYTVEIPSKYFELKMNWYYRPRDIANHAKNVSSRLVYASLHHDICPITSYRGKCTVIHKDEASGKLHSKLELITRDNVFYYDQLYDRHTLKYYDVYPTDTLLNQVDSRSPFLYYLFKRFYHVYVEEGYPFQQVLKRYFLMDDDNVETDNSWDNRCTTCREWCNNSQFLKCDECQCAVHWSCMNPPLTRKPNKGIIWLCYLCLNRQEGSPEALHEVEMEEKAMRSQILEEKRRLNHLATTRVQEKVPIKRESAWYQYVGQHLICSMEDLLDPDLLLPYPFKTSRIGPKYQWSGCNDQQSWHEMCYQNQGFDRGTSDTAELNWKLDESKLSVEELEDYVNHCKRTFAPRLEMIPESCNFLNMILKILMICDYDKSSALTICETDLTRSNLKEPTFTPEEILQFEEGVAKYGSELNHVSECVPTQPLSMIVRYYYQWKKTPNGREIWGNFKGRSKNKLSKMPKDIRESTHRKSLRERKLTKLAKESNACNFQRQSRFIDESCFDIENMPILKNYFRCLFCLINFSPMWYKVTDGFDEEDHEAQQNLAGRTIDGRSRNNPDKVDALCIRCARLWRRYGVRWEPPLEVFKRLNNNNNSSFLNSLEAILDETNMNILKTDPQQAGDKLVEWELVQDAELLARQRLALTLEPGSFSKYKRHSASNRSRLYKMVKRPYDSESYRIETMIKELENMLADYAGNPYR
ncbi:hypothetical protein HG537_0E05530 [Torulaspora globosa]|uniref:BAH-domain-containing protein n=1 Tax=Torulaspora globosa TaxID=48254 RepID=A0A7H9HTY7_9SACH|nr:hypothetical protein HG537_0E05530 [Torulaspora sp. CBS 2947]